MKITLNQKQQKDYKRKIATADLVQLCYREHCIGRKLTPNKLYALCMLTWYNKKWQTSTVKALWQLWGKSGDPPAMNKPNELARFGFPISVVSLLVHQETGFTNFYHAYRNSTLNWIQSNFTRLAPLVHTVSKLANDEEAINVIEAISKLPGIPKPSSPGGKAAPSNLLTPLFAALDVRLRFPIINKADHVIKLHRKLGIINEELPDQFATLIGLINQMGITDAMMLDAVSDSLPAISAKKLRVANKSSKRKADARPLSAKNDFDVDQLIRTSNRKLARLHNTMTNSLRKMCCRVDYHVSEGEYDACIFNYNGRDRDLLIEAKSSISRSHLRLAVGQLYDYRRKLRRRFVTDLAVLLPKRPGSDSHDFLNDVNVKVFWFKDSALSSLKGDVDLKFMD